MKREGQERPLDLRCYASIATGLQSPGHRRPRFLGPAILYERLGGRYELRVRP